MIENKLSLKELKRAFEEYHEQKQQELEIKNNKIKANITHLRIRAKELGKEVPIELLAIVYTDAPVGGNFIEKYKEWIKD